MATTTEITEVNYIFKDNSTYLSEVTWREYFRNMIQSGFFNHFVTWDTSSSKLHLNPIYTNFSGTYGSGYDIDHYLGVDFDPVTSSEVDCYIYLTYDSLNQKLKLVKTTNITSSVEEALLVLSYLMYSLYRTSTEVNITLSRVGAYGIPIAYGIYNKGFWDLSRIYSRHGGYYQNIYMSDEAYSSHVVNSPYCGHIAQYGLAQIYGGHKYNIKIASDYSQSEFLLYPVPVCSLDPATVRIKNNSGSQITLKIPTEYHDMTFDYIRDGVWIEGTGNISYALPDDGDIIITFSQLDQIQAEDGSSIPPKSLYAITQNLKNEDTGEGYTKAEANAIFETQANVTDALALKANTADLGDLAYEDTADFGDLAWKDTVDYETEVTNTPTLGTMASEDDADSDDDTYGRHAGTWVKVPTVTAMNTAVTYAGKSKADSVSIADEYSSSETYELGDLVMKDGQLYEDVEDWYDLYLREFQPNTSLVYGGYYKNNNTIYQCLQPIGLGNTVNIDYLLANHYIEEVPTGYYTFGNTYEVGDILRYYVGTTLTGLYEIRSGMQYGKFKSVSVEELLEGKLDSATAEGLAPLASPAFTGTPTAPTPADGDNSTKIATTAFVQSILEPFNTGEGNVTYYVNNDTGSDTTGTGAQNKPFMTIQKAIEKGSSTGLTEIYVVTNIFNETLSIDGKKIKIRNVSSSNSLRINGTASSTATVSVKNGGLLTLYGAIEIRGQNTCISVTDNSKVIYYSHPDTSLYLLTTAPNIATTPIYMARGSVFVANDDGTGDFGNINIDIANNTYSNIGIVLQNGCYVSLGNVNITYTGTIGSAIQTRGSIVQIRRLNGSQTVNQSTSYVDIGNIESDIHYTKAETDTLLAAKAPLASPAFTGTPTAPTPSSSDDSQQIATTAFVKALISSTEGYAPLASPTFTGTPTAPTASAGTNTTQLATTAFVKTAIDNYNPDLSALAPKDSPAFSGTPTAPTPSSSDNSTKLATTAYVQSVLPSTGGYAPLASPAFTGTPTAPTPSSSDNSTKIATTAYVQSVLPSEEPTITEYYVNGGSGSDSNDGQTAQTAFQTIKKAIDKSSVGNNTIINVTPGTYDCSDGLTISGKQITLRSTGDGTVLITDSGSPSIFINALNIINRGYVHLLGKFRVTGYDGSPVRIEDNSILVYEKVNSTDNFTVEIYKTATNVRYYGINVISNSRFSADGEVTVRFTNGGNVITPSTAAYGLWVTGGSLVQVGAITFENFARSPMASYSSIILYQSVTGAPSGYDLATVDEGGLVLNTASGYYSKGQVDALLSNKANNSTVAAKAPLASPSLTGTPTAPTASTGTSTTQIATTAFVQNQLDAYGLNATTIVYVDATNGNDSTGTGAQSSPYKTIQKAVNTAFGGISVTVMCVPGVYNESVTISGKNIILRGTSNTEIRIVGQSIYPAITIENGGKLVMQGIFTLRANSNLGLKIINNSSVVYERISSSDALAINPLSTSSAGKGLWVENCSSFSADQKVSITIPNSGNVSQAIYAMSGGNVYIGALEVSLTTGTSGGRAIDATQSIICIGGVSGTYQTQVVQTNSIVKIGNSIV